MGVDRGMGDLEVTCVVSCRSADWCEVIEWDFNDPGVGLTEGDYFEPGPALREGDPTQFTHISQGATRSKGVVSGHKPSRPLMYFF